MVRRVADPGRLRAGKAVYCAAGMDLEPEEAAAVKRRVEEAGVAFMAEFPRRHAPATLRLKELIATRLGPPRLLFCHQRSAADLPAAQPAAAGRGRSADPRLVELVDWCRYVVDRPPTARDRHDAPQQRAGRAKKTTR